jgi:hypothetical protein
MAKSAFLPKGKYASFIVLPGKIEEEIVLLVVKM